MEMKRERIHFSMHSNHSKQYKISKWLIKENQEEGTETHTKRRET